MPKYIAFLRAINVGGHVVKMDRLRGLFEALGFSGVQTFINSGNVIFDSKSKGGAALERKIEAHLQKALGYAVETFLRSTDELAAIANYKPFAGAEPNAEGNTLHIGFLGSSPSDEVKTKVVSLRTPVDDFHVREREVYWLLRTRFSDSQVSGALIEKTLGMKATFRNSNTICRLVSKYRCA